MTIWNRFAWGSSLGIAISTQAGTPSVLYDIDFSEPTHTPGAAPTMDLGLQPRVGPSRMVFSGPKVVENFGSMTNGALQFNSTISEYSQLALDVENSFYGLGVDYPAYRIQMDIFPQLTDLNDDFAVLFDLPGVSRVTFWGDGTFTAGPTVVPYQAESFYQLDVRINVDESWWSVYLNGEIVLFRHPTSIEATRFDAMRLSLRDLNDVNSTAYIDNVQIHGIPGAPTLAAIPIVLMQFVRRVRPATISGS